LGFRRERDELPATSPTAKVAAMQALARLLQLVGLTIPILAIIAQLNEQINAGQLLQFLAMSVGLFIFGYLLQQYRGAGK
jgi:hypothetical protein